MGSGPAYPPAPWQMHGQGWLSLFRVRGVERRPDGTYVAAFVSYEPPSALTYSELLVARVLDRRQVEITDIWVDSPPSRDGGRALWAIPKHLADFGMESSSSGPVRRTSWRAALGDTPVATARFSDASALAPPVPFRFRTHQTRDDGTVVEAPVAGRGRALPARSHWDIPPDGPIGFLAGRRPLASFRIANVTLSFG